MSRFLCVAALAAWPVAPVVGHDLSPEEIRRIAVDAILADPGLMMDLVEAAKDDMPYATPALSLTADPNAPEAGNPEGDVTLVKFSDYNCPFCRRADREMSRLVARDPNLRVVYREWPVLGAGSVFAARAALAAREQDLYPEIHRALLASRGRLNEEKVMAVAAEVGLDVARLRRDMEDASVQSHIDASNEMAGALGLTGTPWFVLGDELIPGVVDAAELHRLVRAERAVAQVQ